MSVVSGKIGIVAIPKNRHVKTAVQYDKNDSGEAEPGEFTQGEQLPMFNLSKRIRIPAVNLTPEQYKGGFVPLKCHQTGAEYALFNTDTPAATAPLDVYAPSGMTMGDAHVSFADVLIRATAPYPYNQGIRGGKVPIKVDTLDEPSANLFRTRAPTGRGQWGQRLTYDVGVPELRASM